ncbi:MAG: guanylate kinase [Gammaproteobacteria bacterium]
MQGKLYVISAPSGAGKTSLVRALLTKEPGLALSVSHTTRPMRPGEQQGVHYHFVSPERFHAMIEEGAFLEYARVFDNFYGTSKAAVSQQLHGGQDVVLEIDWQGARQLLQLFPDAISIFILPPSREVLEQRLRARGQDSEAIIARRLQDARADISHYTEYEYLLVNDDFGRAVTDLQSIIHTRNLRREVQEKALRDLLASLLAEA